MRLVRSLGHDLQGDNTTSMLPWRWPFPTSAQVDTKAVVPSKEKGHVKANSYLSLFNPASLWCLTLPNTVKLPLEAQNVAEVASVFDITILSPRD